MENERKLEKSQRRWETVMNHKHANTEAKYKAMKDMLAKKFKREKEMAANMKINIEISDLKAMDK